MGLRQWARRASGLRVLLFGLQNVISSVLPAETAGATKGARYEVACMVRVKDEARFLPEWVAWHAVLGIEHFYVYDNGSNDDTRTVLQPFVDRGLVTVIDWPQRPASPGAERHFFANYAGDAKWVALLDADEFIEEVEEGAFREALRATVGPALALNWRYFGSSDHVHIPKGLVLENFVLADRRLDRHVKVIVRPGEVRRVRNSHNHYYKRGALARTPEGRRVWASFAEVREDSGSLLLLRHYVYRSRDDYERKVFRGFVDSRGEAERARKIERIDAEFGRHNEVHAGPPRESQLSKLRGLLSELGVGS